MKFEISFNLNPKYLNFCLYFNTKVIKAFCPGFTLKRGVGQDHLLVVFTHESTPWEAVSWSTYSIQYSYNKKVMEHI